MSLLVVFVFVASAFAGPSLMTNGTVKSPVMNAAAIDDSRIFTVGTVELAISTLSPFTYTMADEYMVIFPVYSYLLTLDENAEVIGDLATSWSSSPDGLTWTFEITDKAYFINRTAVELGGDALYEHPVTIHDVIYSYNLIQDYASNLHFYFPSEVDGYEPTIASMTPIGDYKMELVLSGPYAPFYNAVQSIPIFPQYWWEPRVDAAGEPGKVDVEDDPDGGFPIGSGFLYYDHDGISQTETEFVMKRNPIWFQEELRGWQVHVDQMRLKECTDAGTAWLELKNGVIDCFMGVSPTVFVNDLPGTTNVEGYSQSTGFVYEFNLNQMTDELRAELGGSFNKGSNSQLLQDPVIKEAFAMCINKPGFISQVLLGLGTVATSLIPDINPWHYAYGTDPSETPVPFDTDGARELLWNNGWKYDAAGRVVAIDSDQCPLYGYVDEELTPLEFRFTTLDTEDEWLTGASLIKTWTADAGFKLNLEAKSSSEMNSDWYAADYDMWLWDWIFSPVSDPSTDVLSVLLASEIGTWNDIYCADPIFDALYNESIVEMDPVARQLIVDDMQRRAYERMDCQLIAYRKELYAVSTEYWTGHGDWNTKWTLMPDQCFPYMYMQISPNGPGWDEDPANSAPTIQHITVDKNGEVGQIMNFAAGATDFDGDGMEYKWFFGDGNDSGETWLSAPGTTHVYTEDGEYEVWLAVRETTGPDLFISSGKDNLTIRDESNLPPTGVSFSFLPVSPDMGDLVEFEGSATDNEGDDLYFTWTFGDGFSAMGDTVYHQYVASGSYTVTMNVTDNRIGEPGTRPVTASQGIFVDTNGPPWVGVGDTTDAVKNEWKEYTVDWDDPDESDTIRYTWYWGDGSVNVTTDNETAWHAYSRLGSYVMTVHVDDLSNLPGHNVSDSGYVWVGGIDNDEPEISSFEVDDMAPYTYQVVTFTATASDQDGDPLEFTFDVGDGVEYVFQGPPTTPGRDVTFEVEHEYTTQGYRTPTLYVNDSMDTDSATLGGEFYVDHNVAPDVDPIDDPDPATMGELMILICNADDDDGDPLTFTWDFGDGSPIVVGPSTQFRSYGEAKEYVFRVWVDDGCGHNISVAGIAFVGASFNLELEVGWNLVSIPLVNHSWKASTLGGYLVGSSSIHKWDPEQRQYMDYYVDWPMVDFYLEPSWGYWVNSEEATSIEIIGHEAHEEQVRSITVPAAGGWVQIGLATTQTDLTASDIEDMYTALQLESVHKWDAVSKMYSDYYVDWGMIDFTLNPGDGMWIKVLMSGVLYYEVPHEPPEE